MNASPRLPRPRPAGARRAGPSYAHPAASRRGLSFVESLLASVIVLALAGLASSAVWTWSRAGKALDLRERALGAAAGRLEMLVALPLHRRPKPGAYSHSDAAPDSDLARILEPRMLSNTALVFVLEVEENPVAYPDYFFGGTAKIRHGDLRRYRLRAHYSDLEIELVTLK